MFESEKEELAYLGEGFDKVFINFVKIETVCSRCYSSFLLKSKLHRHINSEYIREVLPSTFPQSSSSISIIVSKAMHISLGL